jgi:SAM-dependent methyltransferase
MPPGGHILDAGCGSGRDSRYFLQQGFRVTAFDATPELAARAAVVTGQPVQVMTFQEVAWEAEFDGIWACASLLHVPRVEIDRVLGRLSRALRLGGTMYASFKQGEGESVREGRFFSFYQQADLRSLAERNPGLTVRKIWTTADVRADRAGLGWINLLLAKLN